MTRATVLVALWCARAAAHPPVDVDVDPCIADRIEVLQVVQVELGDLLVGGPGEHTHASVTCDATTARLRVDDPISGESLARNVELARAIPSVRARMIALALVELVAASWTELAPAPPSLVAPVLAPPALVVPESHHVRVALTAGALKFSATDPLAGGGVRIADASEFPIGWIVDAQIHSGEQTTSLGDVRAGVLSVGAAAQVHHSWPRARIDLGAGMRGGEVRMVGMATSPGITASAFSSGWLGALVRGQVSVSLSGPITLDAALETGYVLAPVNALVAGRPEVAVDGNWLEVHLGIGVSI